jgi:hypothetical protein
MMNKPVSTGIMTIILYVDDILIMSESIEDIKWLIVELEREYKELGLLGLGLLGFVRLLGLGLFVRL